MKGKARVKADWATTATGEKIHLPTFRKQHKISEYKEEAKECLKVLEEAKKEDEEKP